VNPVILRRVATFCVAQLKINFVQLLFSATQVAGCDTHFGSSSLSGERFGF
jgi:hypothetical protein